MFKPFISLLGLVNGSSTASLESEASTLSCDAISTASQETAIMRDDCSRDGDIVKTHSRCGVKIDFFFNLTPFSSYFIFVTFLQVCEHITTNAH